MTDPPRRLPPKAEDRLLAVVSRMAGGSDAGSTRFARPIRTPAPTPQSAGTIEIVVHGDDGTVQRPAAQLVYWVGAATPVNGEDYDFWYTADVP